MKASRIKLKLLEILILVLPYHYLIFAVVLRNIPILKLWRDLLMIIIILLVCIEKKGKFKVTLSLCVNFLFCLLTIIYIVMSPCSNQAINVARVYILPLLLFHAVQNCDFSDLEIAKLMKKVYVNTWFLCAYGIIQAYVLKSTFLIKLGYGNAENGLGPEFFLSNYAGGFITGGVQRVISTFASANIFAFYLSMVFIIFLFNDTYFPLSRKKKVLFLAIVGVTLVLTFSRSCWLAIAVALIVYARKPIREFLRRAKVYVSIFVVLIIMFIVFNSKIREALMHVVLASFSGTDTSLLSHASSKQDARELIKESPLGLGLGLNGPRALNYGDANLVESSYYLLMFEYGIGGGALYFFDYFYIFFCSLIGRVKDRKREILLTLSLFVILAFLNIPYVQEIECTSLFFVLAGILMAR